MPVAAGGRVWKWLFDWFLYAKDIRRKNGFHQSELFGSTTEMITNGTAPIHFASDV